MIPIVLAVLVAASQGGSGPTATERYRGAVVRDIRLALHGAELPEAAPALIDLESGKPYTPEAVRRSIRQLFALGVFSDIKVEVEPVPATDDGGSTGSIDVLFRLFPRLEVREVRMAWLRARVGTRLENLESRLVDESGVRAGDPLNVDVLNEAAGRVRSALNVEGYLWARVEPEASFQSPTAVVVFHVDPGRQARVHSIEIAGVAPYIENHIRREIGVHEGGSYSRIKLDEGIETLSAAWHALGYYGADVKVEATPLPEGALVDLRLTADIGPRIAIEVEGFDFSEKTLRRLVPLYEEHRFTEDLIEESRANLEERLREQGYRDAEVSIDRETTDQGRRLFLRFVTVPGPRYEVVTIAVEGIRSLPESELRPFLATRTRRRFRSAPFREEDWARDLKEVRTYMRRQGFHEVRVHGVERPDADVPQELTLVVQIDEGPRARIGSVQVEGASEVDPQTALDRTGLVPGAPYDPAAVVEARETILTYYRNEGFREADVRARTMLNDAGTEASVELRIQEGARTMVDRVILSGLGVSRESSVRRLVSLRSGAPLSPVDLLETRQRLVGSGLFRRVDIEVLPADPVTNRSDVLISVEEGPRTTFAYGFGFEERQLLRADVEVTRRNLFGLNRTLSVFTRASFRGGRFITTYRQPDSFVKNLPLFVSVFAEEERRSSFDFNRVGIGLQISKRLHEDQNLFFRYRFDKTKVFNLLVDIDEIDRRFRNVRIASLSIASVTDRRDDPLNPTDGQFRIVDLEWSAKVLGTEAPFLKGLAQQFFYFDLPKNMVAALGLRLGIGQTFREDRDALLPIA